MSFLAYIATCRANDNPAGDFIRDAREAGLPDIASWTCLRTHLESVDACDDAIAAAYHVWQRYAATMKYHDLPIPDPLI